jgi:hypothetical protein
MKQKAEAVFDTSNVNWSKNTEYNLIFLRAQENFANDKLVARGVVFLNDVYEALGLPRTREGQTKGWAMSEHHKRISFGINGARARTETQIPLSFNIDGEVLNKL